MICEIDVTDELQIHQRDNRYRSVSVNIRNKCEILDDSETETKTEKLMNVLSLRTGQTAQ